MVNLSKQTRFNRGLLIAQNNQVFLDGNSLSVIGFHFFSSFFYKKIETKYHPELFVKAKKNHIKLDLKQMFLLFTKLLLFVTI